MANIIFIIVGALMFVVGSALVSIPLIGPLFESAKFWLELFGIVSIVFGLTSSVKWAIITLIAIPLLFILGIWAILSGIFGSIVGGGGG